MPDRRTGLSTSGVLLDGDRLTLLFLSVPAAGIVWRGLPLVLLERIVPSESALFIDHCDAGAVNAFVCQGCLQGLDLAAQQLGGLCVVHDNPGVQASICLLKQDFQLSHRIGPQPDGQPLSIWLLLERNRCHQMFPVQTGFSKAFTGRAFSQAQVRRADLVQSLV